MDEKITIKGLKDVKEILDKNNIEFWLSCGTLLGAIREKRIIPWDYDVDLATWEENIPKILKILGKFKEKGFELYYSEYQKCLKILRAGCEIGIDFYYIEDNMAKMPIYVSNKVGQKIDYFIWALSIDKPEVKRGKAPLYLTKTIVKLKKMLPEKIVNFKIRVLENIYKNNGCKIIYIAVPDRFFKELKTIEFYDIFFKAPKDSEGYLKYTYGEDWHIPKKDYIYYKDDLSIIKKE